MLRAIWKSSAFGKMNTTRSSVYRDAQWGSLHGNDYSSDQASALRSNAPRTSITSKNSIGERGSPWRSPLACKIFWRLAVHEDACVGRGEKAGNPVPQGPRETQVLQDFQEERPCHGVKSFGDINLQQQGGTFPRVEQLGRGLN
jgi:hypothetical protein